MNYRNEFYSINFTKLPRTDYRQEHWLQMDKSPQNITMIWGQRRLCGLWLGHCTLTCRLPYTIGGNGNLHVSITLPRPLSHGALLPGRQGWPLLHIARGTYYPENENTVRIRAVRVTRLLILNRDHFRLVFFYSEPLLMLPNSYGW